MKIVVFSCDKYSWLVPIFLHFYRKNWPNNPYQNKIVIGMGKIAWADTAIEYLESIDDKTFLLLLDDFIINKTIDTNRIKQAENLCVNDISCVRLYPHDRDGRFLINTKIAGFKEYPLDKRYSVSMQPSIWQREFFLDILKSGENIWQTEIEGSKRVCKFNKRVIWINIPIISHCNPPFGYMKKGRIVKSTEKWTKENW